MGTASNGPDAGSGDSCHRIEGSYTHARIGGHGFPGASIEMQHKEMIVRSGGEIPYGPDIVGRQDFYPFELDAGSWIDIRVPLCAIPAQHQPMRIVSAVGSANRPDIAG